MCCSVSQRRGWGALARAGLRGDAHNITSFAKVASSIRSGSGTLGALGCVMLGTRKVTAALGVRALAEDGPSAAPTPSPVASRTAGKVEGRVPSPTLATLPSHACIAGRDLSKPANRVPWRGGDHGIKALYHYNRVYRERMQDC